MLSCTVWAAVPTAAMHNVERVYSPMLAIFSLIVPVNRRMINSTAADPYIDIGLR